MPNVNTGLDCNHVLTPDCKIIYAQALSRTQQADIMDHIRDYGIFDYNHGGQRYNIQENELKAGQIIFIPL